MVGEYASENWVLELPRVPPSVSLDILGWVSITKRTGLIDRYTSVLPLQRHLLGTHRLDGHVPARIFRIAYEACAGSSDESDREHAARAVHIVKDSAAYLKLRYESQFHGKRYTPEARQVFAFEKQQIGFSTMDELLQMLDSGASIFSVSER